MHGRPNSGRPVGTGCINKNSCMGRFMSEMIALENLSKRFGDLVAVDRISMSVGRGEVLGFLGPNGAGKSTTMKMIAGFLEPSEGTATVGGFDVVDSPVEVKRRIGYLPEGAPTYGDMTPRGFLRFISEIRGFDGADRGKRIDEVVEKVILGEVLDQPIDTLSKGFKRRVGFAQAILHDPDVLILDEPTDGLDPNQKHEVRNLIKRMGEKKVIIFSTHILEEVEAACTRAIIVDQGKIVANGTPNELKAQAELAGSVLVRVSGGSKEAVSQKLGAVTGAATIKILESDGDRVVARALPGSESKNGELARGIADTVFKEGWKMEELHTEPGRLDDVFRSITRPDTAAARKEAK